VSRSSKPKLLVTILRNYYEKVKDKLPPPTEEAEEGVK